MLNVADILQFVIDSLDECPLPEQYLVVEFHERVFHVLLDFSDEMDVIDEKHLEEILADVAPVGKEFSEESVRERPVFQWLPVVHVARREHPLDDFSPVVDDQMQLEPVEPSHRALALLCPSLHGLVLVRPLDVAARQGGGVDDGDARALAQGAGLQEQQQVQRDLRLALDETIAGEVVGELAAHVLADVAEIESLQVTVA